MKQFNPCVNYIILSVLFLCSCQKQLRWPDQLIPGTGEFPPTDCKPAAFGLQAEGAANAWTSFAQKWYVNNKVTYLKAFIGPSPTFAGAPEIEPPFKTSWAQITYYFNQVYLDDVEAGKNVLRVTINANGQPEASYYSNEPAAGSYQYDTTYYYFTGKRLDSTISIYKTLYNSSTPVYGWQKYKFMYDTYGSMVKVDGFPTPLRLVLQYDYTRPVAGIIANYHVNTPLKLMEYMELLKLPVRHAINKIELYNGASMVTRQQYQDYQISSTGLVHSYVLNSPAGKYTFYNGWECGTVNSPMNGTGAQPGIGSLDEFKKLYPFPK